MTQYRDPQHAIARAMNCGEGKVKPALWQRQYTAGYRESSPVEFDALEGLDKLLGDSMTHSLMRRSLSQTQWDLLMAIYSANEADQIQAIDRLAQTIQTKAGQRNRAIWIACYCSESMRKKYGKPAYDWDGLGTPDRTLRQWRLELRKQLDGLKRSAFSHLSRVLTDAGLTASAE